MASKAGIDWKVPPVALVRRVDDYARRLWQAIGLLADLFAARMEAFAKTNAPWTDRTGTARQSIRGFAVKQATSVVIWLVGGVDYFVHLEFGTRVMAPRPIIMPTLEAHYSQIMQAVRRLVGA